MKNVLPEHFHQIDVVNWLRFRRHIVFSVPNMGKRSFATAQYLRSEGMIAGAPDLVIVTPPPKYPTKHAVVELKRDAKSKISPEQKVVHEQMRADGWIVIIGFGSNNTIEQLLDLGY